MKKEEIGIPVALSLLRERVICVGGCSTATVSAIYIKEM
jgi:hypothetical protein